MSSGCGHDASQLTVRVSCDPPLRHATVAAFTARALAVQLERLLAAQFSTCNRLTMTATIQSGRVLVSESWHETPFTVDQVADIVREQLVGWLDTEADTGLFAVSLAPAAVTPRLR